jgi:putative transposase
MRQHKKIRDKRRDAIHKISSAICKTHANVVVEDSKIQNMSKSAKGTIEEPGVHVAQKRGLNRSILAQGWGDFRIILGYKLARKGGKLIKVPPHYISQKCPKCEHTEKGNRKTQAEFKCLACGYENNADTVGVMNILAAGQVVINACGGHGAQGQPTKQEPTEGPIR